MGRPRENITKKWIILYISKLNVSPQFICKCFRNYIEISGSFVRMMFINKTGTLGLSRGSWP